MRRYSWLHEDPVQAPVTRGDLDQLENYADRLFAKVGIDVEFTRHFLDRVNDERNKKQITMAELTRIFKQEFKRYGKKIAQLGPDAEAVMKDMKTDVNIPFVLVYDRANKELDLIAKTVMRKQNFATPNPVFQIEGVGTITKQNATKDAPVGGEYMNVKKLGLGTGKPKELHKKARKNSSPNKLFNLGLTEDVVPVNNTEHAIERLKVAAELCKKMGNQPILYRAMHTGTYRGGAKQNLIQKIGNPARKGVMGNFNPIQKAVLKGLNIVSPAQATTEAPSSTSSYFGTNHIMIPGGDFTAYWNADIDDLGGFLGYDPKYAQGAADGGGTIRRGDEPQGEELQKILGGYQKGIPSYSQHKGEVILDTPFYYILNLQSFLSTFGGKKVKELITVQNKSTFSPISAELLASKFKTYSDIGWYLANPATNMLKWIASKEKMRSEELEVMEAQCKDGEYYCNTDQMCKPIPDGYHMMPDGYLMKDEDHLEEQTDVSTQRGRLAYYLKQPEISQGMAVHLGKLPKYYDGKDELADMVPDRVGVYALHPDAWESTFYSLTNKDLNKINRYKPAIVKIPANSIVGDMAIANQFYRTNDADEKQTYAKAYRDSIVPYGSDTSHIKMPEIIMSRLIENLEIEQLLSSNELKEVSMLQKLKQKVSPKLKPELYAKAAEVLHNVLVRKSDEGKLRHALPYYAMAVGRSFSGIDYRTLATYYQDHYDMSALTELRYERIPRDDEELNFGKQRKIKFKTDKKLPNLKVPTKATRTDRIRAMLAMPESEEEYIEEGWKQTLSNLVLGASLTLGGLGALTVKQALDSPDFNKAEKLEIFTAANLPASQLPDELKLPKPKPEIEYTPLTSTTNEKILARVAKKNGIKGIELAAFMSQMAHESEDFSDMVEDNPNVKKYAGRLAKALGNKSMNDAERFIGRGYIQLTGRWNYEWMQKSLGIDLTSSWSKAHQASDPQIAAKIAVEFWKQRVRPKVSDFGDVAAVTKPINSKLHGLKHREARFSKMASAMNELKIAKPDKKDTFGLSRSAMPQVAGKHYAELLDYIKDNGANFKMETVPANSLKAIQGEFSDAGIAKSLDKRVQGRGKKPIIASIDDYIIDGHHRWLAALNTDSKEEVDIIRVNKTGKDLLQLVIDFPKTTYKDIYDD